jgi:hypothetical protein
MCCRFEGTALCMVLVVAILLCYGPHLCGTSQVPAGPTTLEKSAYNPAVMSYAVMSVGHGSSVRQGDPAPGYIVY